MKAKKALCRLTLRWSVRYNYVPKDDALIDAAVDIFGLRENALVVKGEDFTIRLRQLHDQIMVLCGAAFKGAVGFSLCVFAWAATVRREMPGSWLALVPVPLLYFEVTLIATIHHFAAREPSDPPYMEFTLLPLTLLGAWLVWKPPSPPKVEKTRAKETGREKMASTKCDWHGADWARLVLLSLILTTAAVLGWWSTEVLYREQVVYAYDSQSHDSQGATTSQK